MREWFARGSLLAVVVAALALTTAASAAAREIHYLASTFGAGELSLEERSGIVFDKEDEDVYVADTGNDRIARYGADGEPLGSLATLTEPTFLAFDSSSGGFYAVEEGSEKIVKLDSSGTQIAAWGSGGVAGGFGEIAGIAVDSSGNLFVLNTDFVLHELDPAGTQTNQCIAPYQAGNFNGNPVENKLSPSGIAADAEGNIYFALLEPSFYGRYVPSPAKATSECGEITDRVGESYSRLTSPTVDEADNSVFIAGTESGRIAHFTATGERIGGGGPSGPGNFGYGQGVEENGQVTVRSEDETVYVTDTVKDDIAVFPVGNVEPPEVEILEPTGESPTTARLRAKINPGAPAGNPSAFKVNYRFECVNLSAEEEYPRNKCKGPELAASVPSGSEPVLVEGLAEGLEPASEYAVFMNVNNAAYLQYQVPGDWTQGPTFQTGAVAPTIEEEAVSEASESAAKVGAVINPHGAETGYRVEYVTLAQFKASEFAGAAKTPEQWIPAGIKGVPVSVALTGLTGSESYVVRIFATNTIGSSVETVFGEPLGFTTREPSLLPPSGTCANEMFRGGAGAALPDCRAYEQSTPVDKNGGGPAAVPGMVQATEAPDGISFYSQAGIPGGVGAQDYPSFLSSRGDGVWSTQGLLPPAALGSTADYLGLTPGGRYSISDAAGFDSHGEEIGTAVFERDLSTGEMTTVVPYDKECEGRCFALAGASVDGSRVFLESKLPLTKGQAGEETPAGQPNVFLWERNAGRISLVDVNAAGEPLPEGGFAGSYWWPEGEFISGTRHGGAADQLYTGAINAVSRDGSEIVYTERGEGEEGENENRGQLYVRLGLGGSSPTSIMVSAYQVSREEPEYPAAFLEATPDGRYIFFKSRAQLTADAYSGEGTASLYRYDVATRTLIDITSEAKKKFQPGPGVEGLFGTSESGQTAYFVATTALTTEPGPGGTTAEAGQPNVYRWREGEKHPLSFVATLKGGLLGNWYQNDSPDWSPAIESNGQEYPKLARVSADGSAVVFSSLRALTGLENRSRNCNVTDRNGGAQPCLEFFRYSATTGALDCVSCDPTGVRPLGPASMGTPLIDAEDLTNVYPAPNLPRNLSADGSRFFFQTPDPLVAADGNGDSGCRVQGGENKATCMDVYEWEAPGKGSCPGTTANANGGCLFLISTGKSQEASYFADADREGGNVYFFTSSQLVPADRDQLFDIYDANEGGGLASQHQEPTVPCGSRQACQGGQVGAPEWSSPGSSSFSGPGNPPALPAKCKKGFIKRHGKCVMKHHKKRHRRHHRKKGNRNRKHKKKPAGGAHRNRRIGNGRGGK